MARLTARLTARFTAWFTAWVRRGRLRFRRFLGRRGGWILALGAVCAALMAAMSRIDTMPGNPGFSVSGISSPLASTRVDQWQGWDAVAGLNPDLFIRLHVGVDLFFMAAYGLFFLLILNLRQEADTAPPTPADEIARRRRHLGRWLLVVILIDVLEGYGLVAAAFGVGSGDVTPAFAGALAGITTIKWIALIALIATIPSWRRERRSAPPG